MYKKSDPVTRLCASDVDNVWIRGRNLRDELIGKMSFTDFIWKLADEGVPYEAP